MLHINQSQLNFNINFFVQRNGFSDPKRLDCIINKLQEYETKRSRDNDLFTEIQPKVRPPFLKYAVGMVVKYYGSVCCSLLYSYESTIYAHEGVICDWDPVKVTSDGRQLYNVLFHNGLYKDIAEGLNTYFNSVYYFIEFFFV